MALVLDRSLPSLALGARDRNLRPRKPLSVLLLLGVCVALGLVILAANGAMMSVGAFMVLALVVVLTIYRIEFGFFILIFMSLLFGQFEVPGFDTFTFRVGYFRNLKEITYLPYFSNGDANPFELQLLFVVLVWVALLCIKKDYRVRPVSPWVPGVVWFAWVIGSFIYGMSRGGDFLPALWETRALMYLGVIYFFVPQVIRSREQIKTLMWVMIIPITVKAFEGISRYEGNGWSTFGYEAMQAHEDPLLISTMLFLLMGLAIFGGYRRQRRVLLVLLLPLLLGFYVGNRRAAYASFLLTLAAYLLLIPRKDLIRALKFIVPVIVLLAGYTAVFWNSEGSFSGPIRQIKSGFDKDENSEEVVKDRNYYSNLYRKIEDYDLAVTIQNATVEGIGFGTKYEQPLDLVPLDFALRDYMAHNNVVWLLAKVGAVGFFVFWFFMDDLAFRGAALLTSLKDPYLKAVCALSVVAVITLVSAAFFDLHLVRYRTMIFFGVLLGLIPAIQNIVAERPELLHGEAEPFMEPIGK